MCASAISSVNLRMSSVGSALLRHAVCPQRTSKPPRRTSRYSYLPHGCAGRLSKVYPLPWCSLPRVAPRKGKHSPWRSLCNSLLRFALANVPSP
eukprot:4533154-Pyramimonas_sp.AAC.1